MFEIEKGIAITGINGRQKQDNHYPFAQMGVGDSFKVTDDMVKLPTFQTAVYQYNADHKEQKLCIRKISPTELRVWRTA